MELSKTKASAIAVGIAAIIAIPVLLSAAIVRSSCTDSFIATVFGVSTACGGVSQSVSGEVAFTDTNGEPTTLNLRDLAQFVEKQKALESGAPFGLSLSGNILTIKSGDASQSVDLGYLSTESRTTAEGANGESGADGAAGQSGASGTSGTAGQAGAVGQTGQAGAIGQTGPAGADGQQGVQGQKGDTGDKGDTGEKGEKGDKGDTGEQGVQGEKGDPASDDQVLYLTGTVLSISGGNSVDIAPVIGLADYNAGDGVAISGSRVISSTLGTSIGTSEIETSAVTGEKIAQSTIELSKLVASCTTGQVIQQLSGGWACGTIAAAGDVLGDVKTGLQSADHDGWVRLDGRQLSTLTGSQQSAAQQIGFTTVLPDATDTVLAQNDQTLGTVSGSNTRTIARNQLPDVTLGGSTNSSGGHTHNVSYLSTGEWGNWRDFGNQLTPEGTTWRTATTNTAGAHSHTITTQSINGGVTQQSINIQPRTLSVNTFVYLGV